MKHMLKRSLVQQLDDAVEQMLASASRVAPAAINGASGGLPRLVETAAMLRDLPAADFKARLKRDLEGKTSLSTAAKPAAAPTLGKYNREGFKTLSAYLRVAGGARLVDFFEKAFDAHVTSRDFTNDGRLMHADMMVQDSRLEVSDATPDAPPLPMMFILTVDDADAVYDKAIAAGAESLAAPNDSHYGDHEAGVKDPSGNEWWITTRRTSAHSPADQQAIVPGFHAHNAAQLIDFLKEAFGAEDSIRFDEPDGTVRHARLKFGDAYLTIGEAHGAYQPKPGSYRLFVRNVDYVYAQAVHAGAKSLGAPENRPYGERSATVLDPAGNRWFIATHLDMLQSKPQTPAASYIPKGFRAITPYLMVHHSEEFVEFVKKAFDAKVLLRVNTPQGKMMHSQIQVGDSILEASEFAPAFAPDSPITLLFNVKDADAAYERAMEAGASSIFEPRTEPYGDRDAAVRDVSGNFWSFITRKVTPHHPADEADITPHLNVRGAAKFLDFVKQAFGAETVVRYDKPDGDIAYTLMKIGDAYVGLGEAHGEWQARPAALHLYVPNCDEVYNRAMAAGSISIQAPADMPYGDRSSGVTDPFGNRWFIATHQRDWEANQ
jgi:PhnB protein